MSTRTSLALCGFLARACNVLILTFYVVSGFDFFLVLLLTVTLVSSQPAGISDQILLFPLSCGKSSSGTAVASTCVYTLKQTGFDLQTVKGS